jgi:hypothetical protein
MQYRVFNTGDQIWLSERYGKQVVVKLLTHDGLAWSEDEPSMKRLTGAERYVHLATVFCMKLILKVLS